MNFNSNISLTALPFMGLNNSTIIENLETKPHQGTSSKRIDVASHQEWQVSESLKLLQECVQRILGLGATVGWIHFFHFPILRETMADFYQQQARPLSLRSIKKMVSSGLTIVSSSATISSLILNNLGSGTVIEGACTSLGLLARKVILCQIPFMIGDIVSDIATRTDSINLANFMHEMPLSLNPAELYLLGVHHEFNKNQIIMECAVTNSTSLMMIGMMLYGIGLVPVLLSQVGSHIFNNGITKFRGEINKLNPTQLNLTLIPLLAQLGTPLTANDMRHALLRLGINCCSYWKQDDPSKKDKAELSFFRTIFMLNAIKPDPISSEAEDMIHAQRIIELLYTNPYNQEFNPDNYLPDISSSALRLLLMLLRELRLLDLDPNTNKRKTNTAKRLQDNNIFHCAILPLVECNCISVARSLNT